MLKLKQSSIFFIILFSIFLSACTTTTSPIEKPSSENKLSKINRIVVTPPEVSIELITFTGNNERLLELEQTIKTQLVTLAQDNIKQHKFEFIDFDFTSSLKNDNSLALGLEKVKVRFSESKRERRAEKKLPKEYRRSINVSAGSAINIIKEATECDAVLMINYIGARKSGGKMAQEYISSVLLSLTLGIGYMPIKNVSVVDIFLLDAVTGDVLWANSSKSLTLDGKAFTKAIERLPNNVNFDNKLEEDYDDKDLAIKGLKAAL